MTVASDTGIAREAIGEMAAVRVTNGGAVVCNIVAAHDVTRGDRVVSWAWRPGFARIHEVGGVEDTGDDVNLFDIADVEFMSISRGNAVAIMVD